MRRYSALINSETLALLSIICIVGIFLANSWGQRLDSYDADALATAKQVLRIMQQEKKQPPSVATDQTSSAAQPASAEQPKPLSLEQLKDKGLSVPAGIDLQVTDSDPVKWQVKVWHPNGAKDFLVSSQGIQQQMR